MIELHSVYFGYDGHDVLNDVNLKIEDGEFVALIGENGAGKTTLMKMLNGLNKPTRGDVLIDGRNTREVKTSRLAKTVGFLFQNPERQLCQNTAEEEIRFGLRQLYTDEAFIDRQTEGALSDFDLDPKMNPLNASRGEKQRVVLAGLLALQTSVLVLDEPSTGLDYRECEQLMQCIARQNGENGTTIIMVSHDMEIVQDYSRRAVVLHKGRVIGDGPTDSIMRDEAVLYEASLLPAQIVGVCNRLGEGFETVKTYRQLADVVEGRRAK